MKSLVSDLQKLLNVSQHEAFEIISDANSIVSDQTDPRQLYYSPKNGKFTAYREAVCFV